MCVCGDFWSRMPLTKGFQRFVRAPSPSLYRLPKSYQMFGLYWDLKQLLARAPTLLDLSPVK